MKRLADFTFKYWKGIIGINIILTIFFAYFFIDLKIDNSLETMTIDNDPDLLLLRQMDEEYGCDEFVVISFKGDNIFSQRTLAMIEKITERIENRNDVEKVLSLTNASIIKATSDGFGVYPLIPEGSFQGIKADALKKDVIKNRMYKKLLYSDDGNASSILAWLIPLGNDDSARVKVIKELKNIVKEEGSGRKFYFYGMPVYLTAIFGASVIDQITLTPIVIILIGLMLFYFFRNLRLVIIPFIVIYICAVWAQGLMIFAGHSLNFVTMLLPTVLLIVCIAVSIHIIAQYKEVKRNFSNKIDALKDVITRIGIPILLTSLTTAFGFFSLVGNSILPVRNFGFFTGLGVVFSFITSITILPIIMSFLKIQDDKPIVEKNDNKMEALLIGVSEFIYRRKGSILIISAIITIISAIGIFRLQVKQDTVSVLKNQELHDASKFIDMEMGGSVEIDMMIDSHNKTSILEPKKLKVIERIQERMMSELFQGDTPLIRNSLSIVDFLKEMNQAMNNGNPDYYRIPTNKEEAEDYIELVDIDQTDIRSVLTQDYSKTRLRAFTLSADDSSITRKLINQAKQIISDEAGDTDINVVFSGRPVIWSNMMDYLITGMSKSFFYAFIVITIMMILVFSSIKIGILSMIINIIPVIVAFGIMGWLDIPINLITVMVPSIAIGIAVDDTIHLFWRMVKEVKVDGDYKEAMLRSLTSVGKPIITTSLLLCIGFSALYFSQLIPLLQFAFVTTIIVLVALVADLLLGPALMLVFKPVKIDEKINGNVLVPEEILD